MIEDSLTALAAFVSEHRIWAGPLMFALTFVESLAFVSLFIPAWSAVIAMGALVGSGQVDFWPVFLGGSLGAILGDFVSYWIGDRYKERVWHLWPLSKHPAMVARGAAFFQKWGALGIIVARFSGPLRAIVPLAAGVFDMPRRLFTIANIVSAFLWCGVLIASGSFGFEAIRDSMRAALRVFGSGF